MKNPTPLSFTVFPLILLQTSITEKLDPSIPIPAHFVNVFYFLKSF